MEKELLEFEYEWNYGSRYKARQIAIEYINARTVQLEQLSWYSTEGLVKAVEAYRAAGREADRIIVDMWIVAHGQEQHKPLDTARLISLASKFAEPMLAEARGTFYLDQRRADASVAKGIAQTFCEKWSELGKIFSEFDLSDLVEYVDGFRDQSAIDAQVVMEMYIDANFEPRSISAEMATGATKILTLVQGRSQ